MSDAVRAQESHVLACDEMFVVDIEVLLCDLGSVKGFEQREFVNGIIDLSRDGFETMRFAFVQIAVVSMIRRCINLTGIIAEVSLHVAICNGE